MLSGVYTCVTSTNLSIGLPSGNCECSAVLLENGMARIHGVIAND